MSYRPNLPIGTDRIDLRATYHAPCDGTSHPLSGMGLAAAQALYPNAGLTSSTDLTKFEQDTAAFIQAEYDMRTGSNGRTIGGIITLPDGAFMVVSQQLWLQNAGLVWFHGGRNVSLNTAAVPAGVPAIRVTAAYTNTQPLRDFAVYAHGYIVYTPDNLNGTPHTNFVAGSTAILIDYSTQCEVVNIHWNGYDQATQFGQNTYCITFRQCRGDTCNAAVSWSSPQLGSLNSMEKMVFEECNLSNNNYGFDINTAFTENSSQYNQGGSWFFVNCSLDYNVVLQGRYLDAGGDYKNSGLFVIGNHIETKSGISGNSLARFQVQGSAFFSQNEFSEQTGGVIGLVEVMPTASCSMRDNRCNQINVPFMYGSYSGAQTVVSGSGNVYQNIHAPVILLRDGNGTLMQRGSDAYRPSQVNSDTGGLQLSYQTSGCLNLYYDSASGPSTFTVLADKQTGADEHYIGTKIKIINLGPTYPIALKKGDNSALTDANGNSTLAKGGYCVLQNFGPNSWSVVEGNLNTTASTSNNSNTNSTQYAPFEIDSFPGAAGSAPTGNAAFSSGSGFTVDGSGNLLLPTTQYGSGYLPAAGLVGGGVTTWSYAANGGKAANLQISIPGNNLLDFIFSGSAVSFYKVINGNGAAVGYSQTLNISSATSIGLRRSADMTSVTIQVNGADTSIAFAVTDAALQVAGYIGLGVQDPVNPNTAFASMKYVPTS